MDIQEQLNQALKEIDRLKKENMSLKNDLYRVQGRSTSHSRTSTKTATEYTPKEKAIQLF